MVKTNIQTFTGEVEILSNLHVGSYLTANGDASNVLDVTGNVGASFFVGDGGLISNIATTLSDIVDQGNLVANVVQFNAPPAAYAGVGIVTASNVGIQNANPLNTLSIANKIIIDKDVSEPSTTMNVHGKVYASRFEGDGGLLSNIATTLEAIINQGNVSANVVKFSSATNYAGAGMVTDSNVGIQNTAPVFNLSVGSNVHIDDEGSNVLTVHGNVSASNLNLGVFTVSASHGLDQVCAESNVVTRPVRFSNVITAVSAVSNIESAGTFISTDAERGIDVASNIDIGGRLKFDTNVFVDTLRVSDVAANLVTYDQSTGELTDSGGSFMNKFTMVSEQPPSNIFSNVSTGPYTLTTSNLATNSNTFNAFDGTANAWVSGDLAGGYIGGSNVFHETNLTQLSNTHPTQFGDWLAIEFPYKSRLRHMKLTPLTAAQFPASANIYATNDSVTWTEIGYWKDRNPVTNSNVQTISVNTPEDFNKYALVTTKAAGNSSNVAIQDWNLFTESISVDGGKGVDKRRAVTKTFVFTVSNASGANKYYINGVQQSSLQLEQNHTYIFDVSSTTLATHPLRFSTTATGSEYTTGITNSGTYGGGGTATRTFAVTTDTPATLYYFCTAHSGMGATMSISPTAELEVSGRIMSRDLVVTGTGGMSIGGGTTAQRAEYPDLGTIRYNSTTGFMEGYAASGWAPIAQPPTITGLSPLTTLTSGGSVVGWNTTGTKIQASDKQSGDSFGWSVSMNSDGTKVIVGAMDEDTGGSSAGAAYIFTYSSGSWDAGVKIRSSDNQSGDYFGYSVSMNSAGTKVIVGAWGEDTGYAEAGSAYIFAYDGSSWTQEAKIQASDRQGNDRFGHGVSMNSDGTKVIVGAYQEDTTYTDAGSAYIFAYDGSSWTQEAKIQAVDAQGSDFFGYVVSMSGDGNKVIVGAHLEDTNGVNAGSAYIFAYSSGSWDAGTKIQAVDAQTTDRFGYSVSMNSDGTKVIVGAYEEDTGGTDAGAAYIFTYSSGSWDAGTKIQASDKQSGDNFGYTVSMNSDGTKVIVGAYGEDEGASGGNAGAAYIFTYSSGSWDAGTKILASDAEAGDRFSSVAMSRDGTKVIVGAYEEDTGGFTAGAAYIYDYNAVTDADFIFDTSTQVFTATGTGIVSGSTVQLEGADGSLYSVSNVTPNAAGTQVTFKMGSEAVEFPPSAMSTNTSITGYTASASPGSNSGDAWKAFNDVVSTSSNDYWNASSGTYSTTAPYLPQGTGSAAPATTQDISGSLHIGHWIQLQIPNPVILTRAVIGSTSSGYQHGQFVILGSNDGTNWTLLHAGTGTTLSTNVTTLSAGSTEAFKYFRVVIKSVTSTTSGGHLELNNVQFFGGSGSWVLANQPYKVKVNSTSGLIGTSTAAIGFAVGWTTAAGANLEFDTTAPTTHTLVGTDGGGGTNRKFTIVSTIPVSSPPALPSGLALTGSTGVITGQIAAVGTTSVTFRLTDNATGLFTDRAINIVGTNHLYPMTFPFTFTNAGKTGGYGPTLSELRTAYTPTWTDYTSNLNMTIQGVQEWTVPSTGSYEIDVYGARGRGANATVDTGYYGKGARMKGRFSLTKGQILKIVVGQEGYLGPNDVSNYGGTGGGGTFVYTGTTPLIIAGGGGGGSITNSTGTSGTGNLLSETIGRDGQITTAGTLFNYDSTNSTKSSTYGSWYVADNGASGGNWTTSSSTGYVLNGVSSGYSIGGGRGWTRAMATNFYVLSTAGHASAFSGADGVYTGGFGGGNGAGGNHCGGGGGGYSGGASTNYSVQTNLARSGGGGGGSYNSGTNQSNSVGVRDGHGQVIINRL